VNERDEKLTDIPELQDTILEAPAEWEMRGLSCFHRSPVLHYCLDFSNSLRPSKMIDIDELSKKIEACEKLIKEGGDFQTLLDEIVRELKPHIILSNRKFLQFLQNIKEKTPKVYRLLKQEYPEI
jgi:hypothetical protein